MLYHETEYNMTAFLTEVVVVGGGGSLMLNCTSSVCRHEWPFDIINNTWDCYATPIIYSIYEYYYRNDGDMSYTHGGVINSDFLYRLSMRVFCLNSAWNQWSETICRNCVGVSVCIVLHLSFDFHWLFVAFFCDDFVCSIIQCNL